MTQQTRMTRQHVSLDEYDRRVDTDPLSTLLEPPDKKYPWELVGAEKTGSLIFGFWRRLPVIEHKVDIKAAEDKAKQLAGLIRDQLGRRPPVPEDTALDGNDRLEDLKERNMQLAQELGEEQAKVHNLTDDVRRHKRRADLAEKRERHIENCLEQIDKQRKEFEEKYHAQKEATASLRCSLRETEGDRNAVVAELDAQREKLNSMRDEYEDRLDKQRHTIQKLESKILKMEADGRHYDRLVATIQRQDDRTDELKEDLAHRKTVIEQMDRTIAEYHERVQELKRDAYRLERQNTFLENDLKRLEDKLGEQETEDDDQV